MFKIPPGILLESGLKQKVDNNDNFDTGKFVLENLLDKFRKEKRDFTSGVTNPNSDLHSKMLENMDVNPENPENGSILTNDYYIQSKLISYDAIISHLESKFKKLKEEEKKPGSRVINTSFGKILEYKPGSGTFYL